MPLRGFATLPLILFLHIFHTHKFGSVRDGDMSGKLRFSKVGEFAALPFC